MSDELGEKVRCPGCGFEQYLQPWGTCFNCGVQINKHPSDHSDKNASENFNLWGLYREAWQCYRKRFIGNVIIGLLPILLVLLTYIGLMRLLDSMPHIGTFNPLGIIYVPLIVAFMFLVIGIGFLMACMLNLTLIYYLSGRSIFSACHNAAKRYLQYILALVLRRIRVIAPSFFGLGFYFDFYYAFLPIVFVAENLDGDSAVTRSKNIASTVVIHHGIAVMGLKLFPWLAGLLLTTVTIIILPIVVSIILALGYGIALLLPEQFFKIAISPFLTILFIGSSAEFFATFLVLFIVISQGLQIMASLILYEQAREIESTGTNRNSSEGSFLRNSRLPS